MGSLQLSLVFQAAQQPPEGLLESGTHVAVCRASCSVDEAPVRPAPEPAAQAAQVPGKESGRGALDSLLPEEKPGADQASEAPEVAAIESGHATLHGARYGTLNQDVVLVEEVGVADEAGQRCLAVLLLDGHGMLGEEAAGRAASAMMASLRGGALSQRPLCTLSPEEVAALLEAAFEVGHAAASSTYSAPPPAAFSLYRYPLGCSWEKSYALQPEAEGGGLAWVELESSEPPTAAAATRLLEFGTTATVALLQGSALRVGNAGDSLAVLGTQAGGGLGAKLVAVEHNCMNSAELARVTAEAGERVHGCPASGYLKITEGKHRGFQLGMTRALGHRLMTPDFAVLPTPSVTLHDLTPSDVCLIVASDGVWEVMNPEAAVLCVCTELAAGASAKEAAEELCREAVRLAGYGGRKADNTTAAVLTAKTYGYAD